MGSADGLTATTLRGLIVAELEALELDDDDGVYLEQLLELVLPGLLGQQVFSLWWDSGGPGAGAGVESVYRLAGKYLTNSQDFGWDGPFDSLEEVRGSIYVTGATVEVACSEWDEEEILARIELLGEPPEVVINGTVWPFETLEHRVGRNGGESNPEGGPAG